jgi:uncharacterized protein
VTLIVDTGPMIAGSDANDPLHASVRRVLTTESGPLILPAPVTTEVDFLLRKLGGAPAARRVLADIAAGIFQVEGLTQEEHGLALLLEDRYEDLDLGLADLSVMVLAQRFGTRRILTFDARHFRAVRPLQGGSFLLLPDDMA